MEDIFNHSRRAARESNWVWIAKPIALGGEEFPARPDEIRREGGRAKRLFRIHPPPPTRKTYAAVAATVTAATTTAAISAATTTADSAKRVKTAEMSRDFESSGPRRRYEEDRPGGRYSLKTLVGGGVGRVICTESWSFATECSGRET
jgi:hypothetical protein